MFHSATRVSSLENGNESFRSWHMKDISRMKDVAETVEGDLLAHASYSKAICCWLVAESVHRNFRKKPMR